MKLFTIADLHFGHSNIIKYCNRPFDNADVMNEILISNWNGVVSDEDIVYVCGDVAMNPRICKEIVPRLNGKKILIMGNHDQRSPQFYRDCGFAEVSKWPILVQGFYLMSHAPLQCFTNVPSFNFYGHVHNDPMYVDTENSKCISVERINYTPYCFAIVERESGVDEINYSTRRVTNEQ